eukprot:553839-Prorocentrum_lima.AAC.1
MTEQKSASTRVRLTFKPNAVGAISQGDQLVEGASTTDADLAQEECHSSSAHHVVPTTTSRL